MQVFKPLDLTGGSLLIKIVRQLLMNGTVRLDDASRSIIEGLKVGVWVSIERIRLMNGFRVRNLVANLGTPYPISNLYDDLIMITRQILQSSFRYTSSTLSELKKIVIEVTLNNTPRSVNMDNLSSVFIPGYHGLLVRRNDGSLEAYLPQKIINIALEMSEGVDTDRLLMRICGKGCLDAKIFETQIFYELEPEGEVIERKLFLNKLFNKTNSGKLPLNVIG